MEENTTGASKRTLALEVLLTVAICSGIAFNSFVGISAESRTMAMEVMTDYHTLTVDYVRAFKVLKMEAVEQIKKDLSFEEMQAWLVSRDGAFREAVGADVYDGFAYTYKGKYAHSWSYGDYSKYDPNTRPWYQVAKAYKGEVAVVAPYTTYLANTAMVKRYDTLRMSIAQRYNDEISFDFDLKVKEINDIIADRQTIYEGSEAFLYDKKGYILSATKSKFYGHNINGIDEVISPKLSRALKDRDRGRYGLSLNSVENQLRLIYSITDEEGKTLCLLIPFAEVFFRNFLFVLLLGVLLVGIEIYFYRQSENQIRALRRNREALKDAFKRAEEASHAKGDFMSRMSHEIRTPLNAVIGYMDIAREEDADKEKVDHCLEQSSVAAKHLLSIINDILDISSIESGRMKIADEDFDLTQVINSLTTIFYAQAQVKNIDFEVQVKHLTEEWVRGDALRMNQILLNLLSNAIKFTPEKGRIVLALEQLALRDNKVHIQFKVEDNGIGMSEEYRQRMFKPFEQESAKTARKYGGTGLGLSICHNLVKMMGGNIEVESAEGKGTTFIVNMAFDRSKENGREHSATESFKHLKALVVDDDASACEYTKKLLLRCGIKCDTVTTGKQALRRIESRKEQGHGYDLCIVDWNMPEMNGLETAKQIRALGGDKMPIIIATAYDYSTIEADAKQAGVDKIVSKPLFQSTLFNLLVNTYGKYEVKDRTDKAKQKIDFHGMKVLLAEDNLMNMEIAQSILKKAGLVVEPAVNGKEALDKFVASVPGTYEAILMDVQMPIMDGYEATRAIRKSQHAEAKTIPIIAMTANAFTSDVTEALAAGMNDHVSKPISYEHLFAVLRRFTHEEDKNSEYKI